jgi:hypothetical protein
MGYVWLRLFPLSVSSSRVHPSSLHQEKYRHDRTVTSGRSSSFLERGEKFEAKSFGSSESLKEFAFVAIRQTELALAEAALGLATLGARKTHA